MTDDRRDRHLGQRTTVRPDPKVKADALAVLHANDWTLNDFVIACLILVTRNPSAMLDRLQEFRPPPKLGRPKKAARDAG